MKQLLILIISVLVLLSCETTSSVADSNRESLQHSTVDNPSNSNSLVDHLRKIPGITVLGDGREAKVRIRGISSFYASNEPLFLINGLALNGGLKEAMDLIPVAGIRSISVLKNPSDIGIYGVRGSNGVVSIRLK